VSDIVPVLVRFPKPPPLQAAESDQTNTSKGTFKTE
jgi:hypothetical protein